MRVTVIPNVIGELRTITKKLGKGTVRIENQRKKRDLLYYSIIKIGQNTVKSPRDLRRLAVSQTPVKDHQLTLL